MADYVNNKELYEEVKNYHQQYQINQDIPIPDTIGIAIYEICKRMARRPNFKNYTFIDEMIADAIEACCKAIKNFDPEKSTVPFAYLSQCAWNAYVRRIVLENKQSYIKNQMIEYGQVESSYNTHSHDNFHTSYIDHQQSEVTTNNTFDGGTFERKMLKNKKQRVRNLSPIEQLME